MTAPEVRSHSANCVNATVDIPPNVMRGEDLSWFRRNMDPRSGTGAGILATIAEGLKLTEFFLLHRWHGKYGSVQEAYDTYMLFFGQSAANQSKKLGYLDSVFAREVEFVCTALFSKYPTHVPLPETTLVDMALWVAREFVRDTTREGYRCTIDRRSNLSINGERITGSFVPKVPRMSKEVLLSICPRKAHPLAGRKANLFLDLVLDDLSASCPQHYWQVRRFLGVVKHGLFTEDQMCSSIVYAQGCSQKIPFSVGFFLGLAGSRSLPQIKGMSDLLKSLGCHCTALGRCLVELHTLSGRGVGCADILADAGLRVGSEVHPRTINHDLKKLERAIEYVLDMELGTRRPCLPDIESFWNSRFRWCVSGSHSRTSNAHWEGGQNYNVPGERRITRRICSEYTKDNPLVHWNGRTGVSLAEKIEHGKSRAIYSCDTLSYFAFSWLLQPVERAWRGYRVLLDPGQDGMLGTYNRITRSYNNRGRRSCFLMADYADFNSQHSLQAQSLLIKCVLNRCDNVDSSLAKALLDSFYDMHIYHRGRLVGKANSTLMSGHRATTFINSILNAAYCVLAWGECSYARTSVFHVGDDVVALCDSALDAWCKIKALERCGCSLQASKQSVGYAVFEFLRMAGVPNRHAGGYLARAIAGLSSGNWVTDYAMEPLEGLHSLITQCRSLINRSGNQYIWRLVVTSAWRITGLSKNHLKEFLSGETGVMPGPCFRRDGKYCGRAVTYTSIYEHNMNDTRAVCRQPLNATDAYIQSGCSHVERVAMQMAGFSPRRSMALSSYGRMEPKTRGASLYTAGRTALHVGPAVRYYKKGVVRTSGVTTTEVRHGVLAQFPIINLLKSELDAQDVAMLLQMLGVDTSSSSLEILAWGPQSVGCVITGPLPYGDAAGLAARAQCGSVFVDVPICM